MCGCCTCYARKFGRNVQIESISSKPKTFDQQKRRKKISPPTTKEEIEEDGDEQNERNTHTHTLTHN